MQGPRKSGQSRHIDKKLNMHNARRIAIQTLFLSPRRKTLIHSMGMSRHRRQLINP